MSSLKVKFTPQKKGKNTTIQFRKIKRWVILAVLLNVMVVGIHFFFLLGGNINAVKTRINHLLQREIIVADTIIAPFVPVSSYYLGHSYQSDSIADTVSFAKHASLYAHPISDSISKDTSAYYGIDVSRWQSKINWQKVKTDSSPHAIDVALIKATQGTSIVDPYFTYNWKNAQNKFTIGAYHFYEYKDLPKEQAQNFIKTVKLQSGNIRPVVDIELACASCSKPGVSKTKMIRDLKVFLAEIESHYEVEPILYSYTYFYDTYLQKHLNQYTFWMAQYSVHPPSGLAVLPIDSVSRPPHVALWQFSSKGKVNGLSLIHI